MALKGIKTERIRLADQVYDQLVEAIMDQEIGKNDRLVQEKLAAQLQISRTPVREALLRLEKEGVLTTAASGGFRLARMDEGEVRQLYQARAAIEGQAARILTENATKQDLEALGTLIRRQESTRKTATRDYFTANRSIHRAFVEMAGNRFLLEMFDMIWGKAMAFHLFATIGNIDLEKSLGNHLALVEVIATGDKTHALEVFTDHIKDGFDLQIEGLRCDT
ncbi:MAG: GntR family transcriptional regulator [Pseudoprimorskyibacter sp.]|jgi:DNA-binding GntR family transcriptional regulator|nr:GntR family transcriptional regulator [Pseudoprimorskyibacter sp.]